MAGNTTTKKSYGSVKTDIAGDVKPVKNVSYANHGGMNEGQMRGNAQMDKFASPMNDGVVAPIKDMGRTFNDIGEVSGFITDGYIDKGGTPYGEAAKFNFLPPGMEIDNQENAEIHMMPLRKLTGISYPGDGWMPEPRDIEE